jgi:hypothetical protein
MADLNDFGYVYNVRFDNSTKTYTVGTKNSTAVPQSLGSADVNDIGPDHSTTQNDVLTVNDEFAFTGFTHNTDATYTYIGAVNGGFIAQIGKGNDYLLFTNTEIKTTGLTQFTTTSATTTICFLPGTQIATPEGETSVETLQSGDLVRTADGRTVAVRWVGRQTISTLFADPLRVNPIGIKAGALAENVPSRDLYVSSDHAILVDDILVHASALVNGTSIVRAPAPAKTFTYYHVELADHSLLLADNVPAESFIDNVDRLAFDNWDEHEALGEEAAPLVEMAYPRAKAARQVPAAIREHLAARARALFGAVATQAA